MNQKLRYGIYLSGLLLTNNGLFGKIPTVSCSDVQQKLSISHEGGSYVINVLPKASCVDCKIPGTIHIPYHKLSEKVKKWPKDREIIIHCAGQNCPLGKYACELLKRLGFVNIQLFEGGLRAWKSQNLPTIGRCRAGYLKG